MNYFWLTIKHKFYVFLAGLKTKAPLWRLIIHDWSKFTPSEYPHYQRQFFGDKGDPVGFSKAWLHHQNANPHHWEYWISRSGHSKGVNNSNILDMPEWAVREMVADWMGAGKAYNGKWPDVSNWEWFNQNYEKNIRQNISDNTDMLINKIIKELNK